MSGSAFVTADEWQAAFDAAHRVLVLAIDRGDLDWPNGRGDGKGGHAVLSKLSHEIATAVIVSSADSVVTGDITDLPGVQLEIVTAKSDGHV